MSASGWLRPDSILVDGNGAVNDQAFDVDVPRFLAHLKRIHRFVLARYSPKRERKRRRLERAEMPPRARAAKGARRHVRRMKAAGEWRA